MTGPTIGAVQAPPHRCAEASRPAAHAPLPQPPMRRDLVRRLILRSNLQFYAALRAKGGSDSLPPGTPAGNRLPCR